MAISRSSRSKHTDDVVPLREDSDPGGDTEPEEDQPTPKPARTHSRKRLSDVHDTSFTMDSGRSRKSVNRNDDAAEKRKRRQSAKIVPLEQDAEAGPSSEHNTEEREPGRGPALTKQKTQLLTMDQAPEITVPLDVMNANYEEWMKMATDNKINSANTWSFALIDYFHDMSLLRNNTDNSINFQRASCTLDGCVKIWTSRVDSVGTETGKLLNNLANETRAAEDEEDEEGEGGEGGPRKKRAHRSAATLAKDAAQLRSKKLELEFRVDPLFRKTCADFDEGGANGLLMNHLALGVGAVGSLRVVFDASDSVPKEGEDETLVDPPDEVDLSYLRQKFLPDLSILEDKGISSSLHDFSFSKDAFTFDNTTFFAADPVALDDDDDSVAGGATFGVDAEGDVHMGGEDAPMGQDEDFFVGEQAVTDDYAPDFNPDSPNSNDDAAGAENGATGDGEQYPSFDTHRGPGVGLVMAEDGGEVVFNYFNDTVAKNWAGPEHWKLRKTVRRPDAEVVPKPRRDRKEPFKIDFLAPVEDDVKEIAKTLFAPPAKPAAILLAGSAAHKKATQSKKGRSKDKDKEEKRDNQTLPDDMHFSSRQLVTLFLKPKFSLHMRKGQGRGELDDHREVDEAFWAQAAANQAANRDSDDIDATQNGGAIPFNTQFFHDDFDDAPGFDDFDGDGGSAGPPVAEEEQDLLAATAGQTRRVRPETVHYAKRAKRVDVRKLKENIWKNLDIVVPAAHDGERDEDAMDTDDTPATDPTEARKFEKVITGLQRSYPPEKMNEISTSFCFICLLHLANEQGLKLESDAEPLIGEEAPEKKIGDIWNLKIYRDPDATPAA